MQPHFSGVVPQAQCLWAPRASDAGLSTRPGLYAPRILVMFACLHLAIHDRLSITFLHTRDSVFNGASGHSIDICILYEMSIDGVS